MDVNLRKDGLSWLVLLLGLAFTSFVRLRLLDLPLERDEGEYAYAGRLLLEGIPPYSIACNMKLPGTYAAYAAILALLPDTPAGIHFGLWVVDLANALLVLQLARAFLSPLGACAAAASFAVLSTMPQVLGLHAHATHFVVLFALAGMVALVRGGARASTWTLVASGAALGTAVLMKQHAVFLLPAAAVLAWVRSAGGRRHRLVGLAWLILGWVLPLALTAAALAMAGVFSSFWFWTIEYASRYTTLVSRSMGLELLRQQAASLFSAAPLLWVLAATGALAVLVRRVPAGRAPVLLALFVCSFLSVCPGLYFREHYFVTLLPSVALFAGAAIEELERALAGRWPRCAALVAALVVAAAGVDAAARESSYYFSMSPLQACRRTFGANPFPEALEIGRYLRARGARSGSNAPIAIVGSEPEICFYAGRRSASRFLYTYPLVEAHEYAVPMQTEMLDELRAARPEFVVFVHVDASWLAKTETLGLFLARIQSWVLEEYERVGVLDIVSPETTHVVWDESAKGYAPRSPSYVLVYRRRE